MQVPDQPSATLIALPLKKKTMNGTNKKYIRELLQTENEQLQKLNDIVVKSLEQEKLLLHSLDKDPGEKLTRGQQLADKVARFGGSWKFIILFSVILAIWIVVNIFLPEGKKFDPYPFILMNLVLSSIAALQAPVIMMSQNRQEEKDRRQNVNDYMINLKAEVEIRTLHQKMDLLITEQFKKLIETQAEQIRLLQQIAEKK
jgi:uncharacterized membrane protein